MPFLQSDLFCGFLALCVAQSERDSYEGLITNLECLAALNTMRRNKTPGKDGLPYEFYQHFWPILGNDLVAVFNSYFDLGKLPLSQRSALITLLYTKGDHLETKNWRPISLLYADYKILSKVLTNRLSKVILSVVAPEQVCGVPGRHSSKHVRCLQDLIDHAVSTSVIRQTLTLMATKHPRLHCQAIPIC